MKTVITMQPKDFSIVNIQTFYDNVAKMLGYNDVENLRYDCRKIEVSQIIQDSIFAYYEGAGGLTQEDICMRWCCFGPKVNADLKMNDISIEDGFISEV